MCLNQKVHIWPTINVGFGHLHFVGFGQKDCRCSIQLLELMVLIYWNIGTRLTDLLYLGGVEPHAPKRGRKHMFFIKYAIYVL